ncbi:MAG: hypothetical protein K9W43_07820 [Candidatus Thorarchaeota archaeon]|nr:hypothetical protein [Candidatus Thorarchaeota archaeon]
MQPKTQYIIIGTWILVICFALAGAFTYPLNQWNILQIALWEIVTIGWLSMLMLLIYKKSLPGQ